MPLYSVRYTLSWCMPSHLRFIITDTRLPGCRWYFSFILLLLWLDYYGITMTLIVSNVVGTLLSCTRQRCATVKMIFKYDSLFMVIFIGDPSTHSHQQRHVLVHTARLMCDSAPSLVWGSSATPMLWNSLCHPLSVVLALQPVRCAWINGKQPFPKR